MTQPSGVRRRPPGSLVDPVALGWEIERASRLRFQEIAAQVGMTGAALLDALAARLEIGEDGRPTLTSVTVRPDDTETTQETPTKAA